VIALRDDQQTSSRLVDCRLNYKKSVPGLRAYKIRSGMLEDKSRQILVFREYTQHPEAKSLLLMVLRAPAQRGGFCDDARSN
jgi:hypothetical protein